jgi:type I restriction enzyme M protein
LVTRVDEGTKTLKDLRAALDKKTHEQYPKLSDDQCLELLLNRKWYRTIISGIYALYTAVSHRIADRVTEFADRYGQTLPALETDVAELESKVKSHLERMGFVW